MNKAEVLKLLADFISIQSVSADSKRHGEILKAVYFLKAYLQKLEFTVKVIKHGNATPLIIGYKKAILPIR